MTKMKFMKTEVKEKIIKVIKWLICIKETKEINY